MLLLVYELRPNNYRKVPGGTKEFIIKMEGNTGELSDISGSEIHGGRCVQCIR